MKFLASCVTTGGPVNLGGLFMGICSFTAVTLLPCCCCGEILFGPMGRAVKSYLI